VVLDQPFHRAEGPSVERLLEKVEKVVEKVEEANLPDLHLLVQPGFSDWLAYPLESSRLLSKRLAV
jgi:hypothetical protein